MGQEDDIDATSSATTGASSYSASASTAHAEYALVDKTITDAANVPEDSWKTPDYFKGNGVLAVDGAKSAIKISPEGSGLTGEINVFNGDIFLRGVPEKAANYTVSLELSTDKGTAVSNELDLRVYSGDEKLADQLVYSNCKQTADGKYMYDMAPWYIKNFGGTDETVTVPKDIKAWYGSHAELPEVNYGELGKTISLTKGEVPSQTLIIPAGCDLTMVNMKMEYKRVYRYIHAR